MRTAVNRCYRFENVELDVQKLRLTVGGEIRPLEPKSFRLLLFLIENRNRTVPKEEILSAVWAETFVTDNALTRAVVQIRKTINDDAREPKYIETVPSVGYRFIGNCKEDGEDQGISQASDNPTGVPEAVWRRRPVALVLISSLLLVILLVGYFRKGPRNDAPEMRLDINVPASNDPRSFALSPDGRSVVYVASEGGQSQLWLRELASIESKPLTVTEGGAAYPFWSPDSSTVGYFSAAKLKTIDISGGSPQTVAEAPSGRGGSWSTDGVIIFTPTPASPVFRVPASGGQATALTKLDWAGSHRFPQFLPDGQHFLFYAEGTPEKPGPGLGGIICLGSVASGEFKQVTPADTAGLYMPPGWLMWVRAGELLATHLDIAGGKLSSDPIAVADSVFFDSSHARLFSVSANGLVAYRHGGPTSQLVWFDRSGKSLGAVLARSESDGYLLSAPRISPDGRRIAVHRRLHDSTDVWLADDSHLTRFTFDTAGNVAWSSDGSKIMFGSERTGKRIFFVKPSDGAGGEVMVADMPPQVQQLDDWSADGRFILYGTINAQTAYDLWVLPLEGDRKPYIFLQTKFDEKDGRFSPDGQWVAYVSNLSGRAEIYIRPFVGPAESSDRTDIAGPQWQVSLAGGIFPTWRHDGKELYFVAPDSRLMAVPITVKGKSLQPGPPSALFQTKIFGGGLDMNTGGRQFDVAPDGRFLINTASDATTAPITLLQNWRPK